MNSRTSAAGKKGYPLTETMTIYGPDGRVITTTTKEVLELSREPLDAALFDLPSGYTEAASAQELYMPASVSDMSSMDSDAGQSSAKQPTVTAASAGKRRAAFGLELYKLRTRRTNRFPLKLCARV